MIDEGMVDTIDTVLLPKLKDFFEDESHFDKYGYASDTDFDSDVPLFEFLTQGSTTGVPYEVVRFMAERGYAVYHGEIDSFGWLTGVIHKIGTNKKMVFG